MIPAILVNLTGIACLAAIPVVFLYSLSSYDREVLERYRVQRERYKRLDRDRRYPPGRRVIEL